MLKITGLNKSFGTLTVLERLNLEVADGEIVAVVGPSGCGKTTLLNIVAGFVRPDGGGVDLGGARVGYVFQEDRLLPWLTVEENVRIVGDGADANGAAGLIALVGLAGFGSYYPGALSGGMRQRCSIARAYNYRCDLLLMDEPFKSLDHNLRRDMLDVFMNVWRGRRNSVLFITHEIDDALAMASRLVVLGPRPATVLAEFALGPVESPRDPRRGDLAGVKEEVIGISG